MKAEELLDWDEPNVDATCDAVWALIRSLSGEAGEFAQKNDVVIVAASAMAVLFFM